MYVSPSKTGESYGVASFYMTSQLSPCSDRLRVPLSAQTSLETKDTSSEIYQGQATTSPEQDIIAEEDTPLLAAYSAAKLYCASKYLKYPEEGRSLKGMDPRTLFHTKETLMDAGAKGMTITTFSTLERNIYYNKDLHESAILFTTINDEVMHELICKISGAMDICYKMGSALMDERDILWPLRFI